MSWTEAVARICRMLAEHRPSLYPTEEWDDLIDIRVSKLSPGEDSQGNVAVAAVKSALHLWNESLDLSHELSQNIHNPTGSYLHGIMHRMEGDYSNAKYWFRQAGALPVYAEMMKQVKSGLEGFNLEQIGSDALRSQLEKLMFGPGWDPGLFVDLVDHQVTVAQDPEAEELLLELQWMEMKLILQYAFQQTGGDSLEL